MQSSWKIGWGCIGCLMLVAVIASATVGQSPDAPYSPDGLVPAGPAVAPNRSSAPPVTPMATAEGMLGFASPDGSGGQMVTLVDARKNWMTVYSVDAAGQVKLLSSRPLNQDFSVQYNITEPTPAEIDRLNSR